MMMDKETIEKIFNLGADALYNTLDPNTGECDERFGKLREEAVKLFSIPVVSNSEQVIISKKEYEWLKKCEKDLSGISFSL